MKSYFVIFLLAYYSCNVGTESNNRKVIDTTSLNIVKEQNVGYHYLNNLINEYPHRVLIGLFFTDSIYAEKLLETLKLTDIFYCSLNVAIGQGRIRKDTLLASAEGYISGLGTNERRKILDKLQRWLKNDVLLSSIGDIDNELIFEQIINDIPEAKRLIRKYLKDPKQYWGSLDENQSCKLYYDVLSYLLTLSDEKRIEFFRQYFNIACNDAFKNVKANAADN